MIRLETENHNTKEFYNQTLIAHLLESGLKDEKDLPRIHKLLNGAYGDKLIDIACGISFLPFFAAERLGCIEVYAVDFADEFIKIMQQISQTAIYGKKVKYVVGETTNLPFEDSTFDCAVLGEVLEHSEDPSAVITEAARVLKKNGLVAISTPNSETKETHKDKQHIWGFVPEDIKELISKEFDMLRLEIFNYSIYCYGIKK